MKSAFLDFGVNIISVITVITVIIILSFPYLYLCFFKKSGHIIYILRKKPISFIKDLLFLLIKIPIFYILTKEFTNGTPAITCLFIYLVIFSFLPQIICENGIIYPQKYIPWSDLKTVVIKKNYLIINKIYLIDCNKESKEIFLNTVKKNSSAIIEDVI